MHIVTKNTLMRPVIDAMIPTLVRLEPCRRLVPGWAFGTRVLSWLGPALLGDLVVFTAATLDTLITVMTISVVAEQDPETTKHNVASTTTALGILKVVNQTSVQRDQRHIEVSRGVVAVGSAVLGMSCPYSAE